jgi:FkbM family methyltransferase
VDYARRRGLRPLARDGPSGATVFPMPSLERLGSEYGGWVVPTSRLRPAAICYSAGVGEDTTFDEALVRRFGCRVYAFDPTPRAVAHVQRAGLPSPLFTFAPLGLWDADGVVRFYAPADPSHVSHSILNLQGTEEYFEAPCRRLRSLMADNGHRALDLLKLDIEGAEHQVIDSLLEDGIPVEVICVEYHGEVDSRRRSIESLLRAGFRVVAVEGERQYTLVRGVASVGTALSAVAARWRAAGA